MVTVSLNIDLNSFSCPHDKILGKISWHSKSFDFPSKDWSDFVVIILCWWLDELVEFNRHQLTMAEFWFMDGAYMVRLHRKNDLFFFEFQG